MEADGEDIVMDDDENADREFDLLKHCIEQYKEQMEGNPWIRELVSTRDIRLPALNDSSRLKQQNHRCVVVL